MSYCREQIAEQLRNREDFLSEIEEKIYSVYSEYHSSEQDEVVENLMDQKYEMVLSLDKYVTFKILMSTGGPADWVEVLCSDSDRLEILSMNYHFSNWFDHAEVSINEHSPLWQWAEEMLSIHY
jgi:hypothetical protein